MGEARRVHVPRRAVPLMAGCAVAVAISFGVPAAAATATTARSGTATRAPAAAGTDTVDEIHSSFGDSANSPAGTSMWVGWRGSASAFDYGTDTGYGGTATPTVNSVRPIDIAGPFEHVMLTGLSPGTVYHYRIDAGVDHQFETAPAGDFTWDDIGDTGSTYVAGGGKGCANTWMSDVWQQIAAERPDFVSHGGDISYANECGVPAVHQLFQDIEPIATQRAWEQSWGNHEYGAPNADSPPGTPRESMANYKGRLYLANPQSSPNDTTSQVSNPGCPSPANPKVNGCLGSDWGSYQVGHVLIIEYPEVWPGAITAWQAAADALMAKAEADPNVYFVVTTGHRPAYTRMTSSLDTELTPVLNALGDKYSPSARTDGKYVLNIAHHVHGGEVFAPQHGVVQMTNGGGGTEQASFGPGLAAGELFRTEHFEHLRIHVTATSMRVDMICGPTYPPDPANDACTTGDVIWSTTLHGYAAGQTPPPPPPPPPPPTTKQWVTNPGLDGGKQTGWTGIYNGVSRVSAIDDATGNWRLRISTTSKTKGPAGVNNPSPFWVNNASTAGKTYTGTAQAEPSVAGEHAYVLLRESTPAGAVIGSAAGPTVTLNTTTTYTQIPAAAYTARASGNSIRYSLVVTDLASPQVLYADDFSLTSPT